MEIVALVLVVATLGLLIAAVVSLRRLRARWPGRVPPNWPPR